MQLTRPLNLDSPIPLYRQLADALTAAIERGLYAPGQKLPSEPSLASEFGVTRPTVRQATRLLAERRLVQARRGAGTFVCAPPREVDLFSLAGSLEAFQRSGVPVQRRLLGKLSLTQVPAAATVNPFSGRLAYQFKRLSRVRRRPILLEEFYVDPVVFPNLETYDLSATSLARVVRDHYFMTPRRGRQTFESQVPDAARRHSLDMCPGQALLLVRRTLDFPGADAALFVELYCRTDECVFSQSLVGQL